MDARELLEQAYEAFNSRQIDDLLALMQPDVEWPNSLMGGVVQGHDAVRSYWQRQWMIIDPRLEPGTITELPDGRLAVEVRQIVRDLSGALLRDITVQHVYSLQDGLIKSMEIQR